MVIILFLLWLDLKSKEKNKQKIKADHLRTKSCIALFLVLDYFDQFKAIKENLIRGVGHLYTLRIPTYLRLSKKPKFVVFFLEGFPN